MEIEEKVCKVCLQTCACLQTHLVKSYKENKLGQSTLVLMYTGGYGKLNWATNERAVYSGTS